MHRFIPRRRTQIFEAATERNVPNLALSVIDLEGCTLAREIAGDGGIAAPDTTFPPWNS